MAEEMYRERITAVLREAFESGEWWVSPTDLRSRTQIRKLNSLGVALHRMERRGEIQVDRSQGVRSRRYSLITPGEFELLMTRAVLTHQHGWQTVVQPREPSNA